jgi:anti-sigma-K factor RskA
MTCAEFKAAAAAYALGALEAGEAAACAAHLAEAAHEGCPEELARAEAALALVPQALPPERPAPAVWKGIAVQLEPRRRRGLTAIAVAGWAMAVAAIVLLFLSRREVGELRNDRAAVALLALPGTKVVPLAPQGDAPQRAVALVNVAAHRAVVVGTGLVPQEGKDYELWVIRGDQKLAAGLMRGGPSGTVTVEVDPRLLASGLDALAVTLEPAGGGEQPRGPILLVGAPG